jgi:hypothetical protein
MNVFYGAMAVIGLVILGQYQPKIALALAALILLSTTVLNVENFKKIAKGDVF